MSLRLDYESLIGGGPCAMEIYNAHMAVPGAGPTAVSGHCRICDGKPHASGTSAAYEQTADLLGLFDVPAPAPKAADTADLLGLFDTPVSTPEPLPALLSSSVFGNTILYNVTPAPNAPDTTDLLGLFDTPVSTPALAPVSPPPSMTPDHFDQLAAKALRMPVQPLDKISEMAVRQMIPQYEAEALVAYLYPKSGYNKNTSLALQVINRIARQNGMTRYDAEEMLRE